MNADALDFTTQRFLAVVAELDEARMKLAAVEAVIDEARRISPSPSMSLYVADLERALGREAPRPHKLGQGAGS